MTKYLTDERFIVHSNTKEAQDNYRANYDRIFGEKPLYYAHPVWLYGTERECADVDEIVRQRGCRVVNPNAVEHERAYQARKAATGRGMDYFLEDVLPACSGCVFRADADGKISSGVALEARWFLERGLPVYEITDEGIVPADIDETRVLTIEESRQRCGK